MRKYFFQFYENFVVLCTLAGNIILFCNIYVDHILLTFDSRKVIAEEPFKDKAQTVLFKDPVRTAQ
jgi:regulatory protein YycI of two-component signal transduction system YycFG